jgi:hypothetical protein
MHLPRASLNKLSRTHWASSGGTMAAQGRSSSSSSRRQGRSIEMDEHQAHRFLTDLYSRHIPQEEYNVRHPQDYVMEMPQSGECFRDRENMRAFQQAHPAVVSAGAPGALGLHARRRVDFRSFVWLWDDGSWSQGARAFFDGAELEEGFCELAARRIKARVRGACCARFPALALLERPVRVQRLGVLMSQGTRKIRLAGTRAPGEVGGPRRVKWMAGSTRRCAFTGEYRVCSRPA